ncbi:MAG: AAA family ATPase [Candidatus Methanomethylophilaceae archaeon]|nr:AAA family ATPase [Candidatus Methanomethylophilaceae archaeon]
MVGHDEEDMRGLPVGNSDFMQIRKGNGLYVDKTKLIIDILENERIPAFLFTRPRRFGKSLAISMLDAFFNMDYAGNDWFDGLDVSKSDLCNLHKNAYPVICINLKDALVSNESRFTASWTPSTPS